MMGALNERERGILMELYRRFGTGTFRHSSIAGVKVSDPFVLRNYNVGLLPANRNLNDKRVLGSRLIPNGYVEPMRSELGYRITEVGARLAQDELQRLGLRAEALR
jgi:hypothetical protein